MEFQITCIVGEQSAGSRVVKGLGGPDGFFRLEESVQMIRMGHVFWIERNGNRSILSVTGRALTGETLTSSPDGSEHNHLWDLPECKDEKMYSRPYATLLQIHHADDQS